MPNRKLLAIIVILQLVILIPTFKIENVVGQERVLRILNLDGSSSVTLGSSDQPLPPGGIPFTIKVVLEGATSHLNTFQVGLKFNSSILNCTGAWLPKKDPSFVFYNQGIYEMKDIDNTYNPARPNSPYPYVTISAILHQPGAYVDVEGGLLALINFTAIGAGTTTIEFYPEPFWQHQFTFLLDENAMEIPYTEGGSLFVTVLSAKTAPIATFTYSPKIVSDVSAELSKINLTNPVNSKWSGVTEYTCVDWFDYEPSGLNKSDILYMKDPAGKNSTWFVSQISIASGAGRIYLTLWSWSDPTVKFDASGSYDPDGYIVSYMWDFGDGTNLTTTEKIVTHTYEGRGYYAVNLTIVDNDEKSSSLVKYVPLGYPPKAVFFTSPVGYPVEAILPGQIITFNASLCVHPENLNITSYEWDFGDGNVTETTDPVITHSYAKRGLYRIKLTAKDLDGLPGSTVKEIQVGIPPLARFTFDPARPKIIDITQGVEITFDASESQGGEYGTVPIVRFVWNFDDGFIEETNVTQIKHPYYSPGNWNVTLTVYDADGLRHSFSQIVSVTYEPPLGQSGFPLHILALIIIIAIIVAVVIVRRKRAKEEEEALEI